MTAGEKTKSYNLVWSSGGSRGSMSIRAVSARHAIALAFETDERKPNFLVSDSSVAELPAPFGGQSTIVHATADEEREGDRDGNL